MGCLLRKDFGIIHVLWIEMFDYTILKMTRTIDKIIKLTKPCTASSCHTHKMAKIMLLATVKQTAEQYCSWWTVNGGLTGVLLTFEVALKL